MLVQNVIEVSTNVIEVSTCSVLHIYISPMDHYSRIQLCRCSSIELVHFQTSILYPLYLSYPMKLPCVSMPDMFNITRCSQWCQLLCHSLGVTVSIHITSATSLGHCLWINLDSINIPTQSHTNYLSYKWLDYNDK